MAGCPGAGTPRRLLPVLLLCALGPPGAHRTACAAEGAACARCAELDVFEEALHISAVPFTRAPRSFLARFEFSIKAPLSSAFRADQFDAFPKSVGKLLNARPAIVGFEAALTQGRWKSDEWGPPPREFRPPGALLVAATNSTSSVEVEQAWKFLISALAGSLCASFEGMDPDHESSAWVRPLGVPWAEPGSQLQFATLPYEPVCTENLTPWLKLLPCGRHRGLAALLDPLAIAESPLTSLALAVSVGGAGREVEVVLRASLDVILPLQAGRRGFAAWFGGRAWERCPAADRSLVLVRPSGSRDDEAVAKFAAEAVEVTTAPGGGVALAFLTERFVGFEDSEQLLLIPDVGPAPWAPSRREQADGLRVMRDVLSQEGRSERTHGRYLLRFTNGDGGVKDLPRRVRFMDQLPFFLRPLWHTFHAAIHRPGAEPEELSGLEAMQRLDLRFVPSDGHHAPTEVFLTADVPPGGTVSIFLDVLKNFIQLREFSYACEKGFDVGSAAWLELAGVEAVTGQGGTVSVDGFLSSLQPMQASGAPSQTQEHWMLRFTEGLLILVPMPDFSMPFNVIALSSTAVTFFFGSIFRLTAAGRMPHWVTSRPAKPVNKCVKFTKRLVLAALLGGLYVLHETEPKQLKEIRESLPPEAIFVADLLDGAKDMLDRLFDFGGH